MDNRKNAFLSYSHEDKDFADRIARELLKAGIQVWLDKWEIKPGDSLIQKIFMEGLAKADVILILLSKASAKSKWVREELDTAMIKKIEGVTRIIPLIKEATEIPPPLRALLWVDLSTDFDAGIREIAKAVFGVSERPPLGSIPDYITDLAHSVGGLSRSASTVGLVLLKRKEDEQGFEKSYSGEEIQRLVPMLKPEEINDAVDELEEYGLVRTLKTFGTAPYNFADVAPTYALFLHFKDAGLDYNPVEDIKVVASIVAAKDEIDGKGIQERSGLSPIRINRAVSYLEDYGMATVLKVMGTAPFSFGFIHATRKTRQFVAENAK